MKIDKVRAWLKEIAEQAERTPSSVPQGTELVARALIDMLGSVAANDIVELRVVSRKENIGSLVIKLAEVSKFGKQEWIDLINTYGIRLDLNPRDSARDVMGKLARHLRDNPAALALVSAKPAKTTPPNTRAGKTKRHLAENLRETLTRLLDE